MRVRAVLFAALAQSLGVREEWIELPEGASAEAIFQHYKGRDARLELGRSVILAVNGEFAEADARLREGDEVALLPPMSGGCADQMAQQAAIFTALVYGPIPAARIAESAGTHGGVVTFEGVVRNSDARGRRVVALEYEAYESMARARLEAIARETAARWPLLHVEAVHRLGRVEVGEVSVRVVVACAHRAEAFEACRYIIDTLKRSVPIWKKEHFENGSKWAEGEKWRK